MRQADGLVAPTAPDPIAGADQSGNHTSDWVQSIGPLNHDNSCQ